jgi:hypothetical protein
MALPTMIVMVPSRVGGVYAGRLVSVRAGGAGIADASRTCRLVGPGPDFPLKKRWSSAEEPLKMR